MRGRGMISVRRGLRLLLCVTVMAGSASPIRGQMCGNRATEGDEQCDDGNTNGGDGCAANCTEEIRRPCYLRDATLIYQDVAAHVTPVRGVQVLTIGRPRASDPFGDIPFVVRAGDLTFENQVSDLGACSCVQGMADGALGPDVIARGRIGCGAGLAPIEYTTTVDHNTHLSDPDPDPQCAGGHVENEAQAHPGACNGPPQTTGDVDGPPGSVTAVYSLTNYLLEGAATCDAVAPGAPDRPQGADGVACTADDPQWRPSLTSATTGRATTRLLHAGNDAQAEPRELSATGTIASCTQLADTSDPERALEGLVLVASSNTLLDTFVSQSKTRPPSLEDLIGIFRFACAAPPPTASPTPTPTPEAATATPTSSRTPTPSDTVPMDTPTATPTDTSAPGCAGDCDGNDQVRVDELVRGVNIALDRAALDTCRSFDGNGDGFVRVNELVIGVNHLLRGC